MELVWNGRAANALLICHLRVSLCAHVFVEAYKYTWQCQQKMYMETTTRYSVGTSLHDLIPVHVLA